MLLDEPFSALDAQTKMLLQRSFGDTIAATGTTTLLITHDLTEAVAMLIALLCYRSGRAGWWKNSRSTSPAAITPLPGALIRGPANISRICLT